MDFNTLFGKRISILITGWKGKETYSGIVDSFDGTFLILHSLPCETFEIDQFCIRTDIIESIWIYKVKP